MEEEGVKNMPSDKPIDWGLIENVEKEIEFKPILIIGHIGIGTKAHVAHILALYGLKEHEVYIITPGDAKERGILIEASQSMAIDVDMLIKKIPPEVFELKAMPQLEMATYITPSHRREFVPRSNKRNNLKKKRR